MSQQSYTDAAASPSFKFNTKAGVRFCELIDPSSELFEFRLIPNKWLKDEQPDENTINYRGRLDPNNPRSTYTVNYLKTANRGGRGVFMQINKADGTGVKAENIVRVRAVFADLDDGLPEAWPLDPSFIVNSSPGKYQAYWLVADKMTRDQFASVMRGIGERWGSASEAKDIARVLRVPGFWHQKDRDNPYRVRFHQVPDGEPVRYRAAKLVRVFGVEAPKAEPIKRKVPNGERREWTDDDVEAMLNAIPASDWDTRDNWLRFGMALHHHCGGDGTGYDLWCRYASQSDKFDAADSARTWRSFKGGAVTLGTVVHHAKANGWQPERRERKDEGADATARERARYEAYDDGRVKARKAGKSQASDDDDVGERLVVKLLSEYQSEHIDWLWRYRIPKSMISLLAGFGDVGKSTLIYDISARITRGAQWPNNEGRAPKGSVIFFNREDTPQHVIRPRILAAGGDPDKVYIVDGMRDKDGNKRTFNMKTDLEYLDKLIKDAGDVQLVVFDPLSSYFDANTNTWRESQVRQVLEPMGEKVNEWGVALIGNTHLGKSEHEGNANLRILNSVGIVNLARIINMVQKDEEDPDLRIFGQTKRNIAKAKSSLRFGFETDLVDEHRVEATRLVWQGVSDVDVETLMNGRKGDKLTQRDVIKQWLKGLLSNGPKSWDDIVKAGKAEGYVERTLRRARDKMQEAGELAKVKEPGKMFGGWHWALAGPDPRK